MTPILAASSRTQRLEHDSTRHLISNQSEHCTDVAKEHHKAIVTVITEKYRSITARLQAMDAKVDNMGSKLTGQLETAQVLLNDAVDAIKEHSRESQQTELEIVEGAQRIYQRLEAKT